MRLLTPLLAEAAGAPASCADDEPPPAAPPAAYNTAAFLPGLNNVAWGAVVNDQLVALAGVGVIRDGSRAVSYPQIEIFSHWSRVADKRAARPDFQLATLVKTYPARAGLLYRVFVASPAPIACLDLVIPYSGFAASAGRIHYFAGTIPYVAPYKPRLLR